MSKKKHRLKYACTFSRGIRHEVIRGLKDIAFMQDLSISVDEDKRFWASDYRILIKGNETGINRIESYMERVEQAIKKMAEEDTK